MSYHLCIKLCTYLSVHRTEAKKNFAKILYYIVSKEKKNHNLLCTEETSRERREEHVYTIRDDILIKALCLGEESHKSKVFL